MKLLQLHLEHKLPDDFEGSLADALRVVAEYLDSDECKARIVEGESSALANHDLTLFEWETGAIYELVRRNEYNGSRSVCLYYVGEFNVIEVVADDDVADTLCGHEHRPQPPLLPKFK